MGFGNVRYHKKSDEYELYRYCVKSGYTILGGAQKLLKHFETEYAPKRLVSYSMTILQEKSMSNWDLSL